VPPLQRRTLVVLAAAQVFGGIGFFLGVTVAAILARDISGDASLSGIPIAFTVAVGAIGAAPLAQWMARSGRRPGLAAGHLIGAAGAAVVVLSAGVESFPLLCLGMAAFGLGNTSNLLARFAATDLAPVKTRATAISVVLLATAAGAVAGPNFASACEPIGEKLGVLPSAGPFAVAIVASSIAATILLIFLRPDPLLAAREQTNQPPPPPSKATAALRDLPNWPRLALVGVAAMAASNLAMVAVMTTTPLYMSDAGESLAAVGLVISLHVGGMFMPSPITGILADLFGRLPVIAGGGAALVAAGALAAVAPGDETVLMAAALMALGLGWNFGLVGGSALLTDAVPQEKRAQTQGAADLVMGLTGVSGNLVAGPLFHAGAFGVLGVGAAVVGALLMVLAGRARPALTPAESG
jgi:MFS family permease